MTLSDQILSILPFESDKAMSVVEICDKIGYPVRSAVGDRLQTLRKFRMVDLSWRYGEHLATGHHKHGFKRRENIWWRAEHD